MIKRKTWTRKITEVRNDRHGGEDEREMERK